MRPVQLRLAVLVDGRFGSASEVTAAVLREAHRTVIVGERKAGAVSGGQQMPLPEGAALQVAVQHAVMAQGQFRIDRTGVDVDVRAADTRSAADYRDGRDPQRDAAIAALDHAPPPPHFRSTPS